MYFNGNSITQLLISSLILFETISIASPASPIGGLEIEEKVCGVFELTCKNSTGNWTVIYPGTKKQKPIDLTNPRRFSFSSDSQTLRIHHVKAIDSGKYLCDGKGLKYLHVQSPEFYNWATPSDVAAIRSQTVSLTCRMDGTERSEVSWYHNNQSITLGDGKEWAYPNENGNYDLKIVNVQPSDSGKYQCRKQDSEIKTFGGILTVVTEPTIEKTHHVELTLGESATLSCPKFPHVSHVDINWMYENLTAIPSDRTLQIVKVEDWHAQVFYCWAIHEEKFHCNAVMVRVRGCPDGWKHLNNDKYLKCYKFETGIKTYMAAERSCRAHGGHLAMLGRNPDDTFDYDNSFKRFRDVFLLDTNKTSPSSFDKSWIGMDRMDHPDSNPIKLRWADGREVRLGNIQQKVEGDGECVHVTLRKKTDQHGGITEKYERGRSLCGTKLPYTCEISAIDSWKLLQRQNERCKEEGFQYFHCERCCYKKFPNQDAAGACKECQQKGYELAMPKTRRELRSIRMMLTDRFNDNEGAWIMYRHGTIPGYDLKGLGKESNKPCLKITPGGLRYEKCEAKLSFVCQLPRNNPTSVCRSTLQREENIDKRANALKEADSDRYPWFARLATRTSGSSLFFVTCSGVVIGPNHVALPATCMEDATGKRYARAGRSKVFVDREHRQILDVFVHPDFRLDTPTRNNIAVIELIKTPVEGCAASLDPACLPDVTSYVKTKGDNRDPDPDADLVCVETILNNVRPDFQTCTVDINQVRPDSDGDIFEGGCETKSSVHPGSAILCTNLPVPIRWDVVGISTVENKKYTNVKHFVPWLKLVMRQAPVDQLAHAKHLYHMIRCNDESVKLTCDNRAPKGYTLGIKQAKMERRNLNVCYYKSMDRNHYCRPKDYNAYVFAKCHGHRTCEFTVAQVLASEESLHGPNSTEWCKSSYAPYVNITYTCTGLDYGNKLKACESMPINVGRGEPGVQPSLKLLVASGALLLAVRYG